MSRFWIFFVIAVVFAVISESYAVLKDDIGNDASSGSSSAAAAAAAASSSSSSSGGNGGGGNGGKSPGGGKSDDSSGFGEFIPSVVSKKIEWAHSFIGL